MRRSPLLLAGLAVGVLLVAPLAARVSAQEAEPPLSVPEEELAAALACTEMSHPDREPVLLVHGTGVTPEENWGWNYAAALPGLGYDVCTVRLPDRSSGDIQVSSEYVVHAVRAVAERSGRRVDVLGHSQGGLQPRWLTRWWPVTRALVDDLVTLASPHHGTLSADAACATGCSPSVHQMRTGSRFLAALNSGDETPGDVSYTSIATRTDQLMQPVESAAIEGGSNIVIQDLCPGRATDHAFIAADAVAYALVADALTQPGPTDVARFDPAICAELSFVPMDEGFQGGLAVLRQSSGFDPTLFAPVPAEPPLAPYATGAEGGHPDDDPPPPDGSGGGGGAGGGGAPEAAGGGSATIPATGGSPTAAAVVACGLVVLALAVRSGAAARAVRGRSPGRRR